MRDELPAEIREAALTNQYFLADPGQPPESRLGATGYLTRAAVEAAFAQLMETPIGLGNPVQARAELALARWLNEQPPGTAEKLLRQMHGGAETE